ncbi:hypothetical protein [Actinomycetospora flava]|uniref:PE family protein n=1 Tax=Actinomycetospora flava TaxID=3129232 RepID=A0ABU8M6A2_9PSEU
MTEPLPPPLQADSPITLPDGGVVPRYRPPAVGGGMFTVDLDQAPQAIRELEEAARELVEIRREAEELGRVTPPTQDLVTRDANDQLRASAVGGNGSFTQALDSGIMQVNGMIAALQKALADYRGADEQNEAALRAQ